MSYTRTLHRLVGDGDRTACGARLVYSVRYVEYAREYLKRHPDTAPCGKCWPALVNPK